jgi:diguanylate cyclase (GGDEF)-like protein/PAS domain S-box-containing protein
VESKVTRGIEPYGVSPALLAQLCDRAPDAISVVERRADTTDYIFRYLNKAFERLYECNRDETLGTSTETFMARRSLREDFDRVAAAFTRGEPFRVRRGMTRPDGSFLWIEVNFQPIPWDDGSRWMFITRDVTREKEQNERMVQLTTAVENGVQPVSISNAASTRWTFSYVNDAFTRATGYVLEEVVGKSWDDILGNPGERARIETLRAALYAGQQVRSELAYRAKNGHIGTFEVQIQPLRDNSTGEYSSIVSIYQDITEARQREQKLLFEAEHDPLTGLYNRRFMERALETAISMTRSKPVHAFLFADLDGFKEVNDSRGHATGDEVLKAAARAFEMPVFQTDALARWGGDEFAVLLYHCSLSNAQKTAEEMIAAFHACPGRYGTTVSIGAVAVLPHESVVDLIRRADRLCYQAKAAGRDRALAEPERTGFVG